MFSTNISADQPARLDRESSPPSILIHYDRSLIAEYKCPVLGTSQITNQAIDQKPERHPSRNVCSYQVTSTLSRDNQLCLPQRFLSPHTIIERAFDADGNRIPLDLHGLTRNNEQTVDVMRSTPRLHHRLDRVSLSALWGGDASGRQSVLGGLLTNHPSASASSRTATIEVIAMLL